VNAIKIGKELREKGEDLQAIRLDSGDMAELSKEARTMLDKAGFQNTKIIISNDVDEYFIRDFKNKGGKADIWGIGTKLVTCYEEPALGGVYKLVQYKMDPRIKVSGDPSKTNIPGDKELFRCYVKEGKREFMQFDVLELDTELVDDKVKMPQKIFNPYNQKETLELEVKSGFRMEPMLKLLYSNEKRIEKKRTWREGQENMKTDLAFLQNRFSRLNNPDLYNIYISERLHSIRQKLITRYLQ
jgi:nicotinate phosphoribosyltransferase